MKPKKIPITTAKDIANNLCYDEVIIVGCHYETGTQHVTTYGKSIAACENAAIGGNAIKNLLGWPEDKCKAVPKRAATHYQTENKRLVELLKSNFLHDWNNLPIQEKRYYRTFENYWQQYCKDNGINQNA